MLHIAALLCLSLPADNGYIPELSQTVVYEANLRTLTPHNSFRVLSERLPKLRALGVNVLWLMPIHPVGHTRSAGGLGSPYAPSDYYGVNPEFGTEADLHALVRTAHRQRMGVILDWVPDHTSWDSPWIAQHPDWYQHNASGNISIPPGTNWNDVAALDYHNPSLRGAMVDAMKFWVTQFDVDGFRCDAADRVPLDYWKDAISALRSSTSKRLLMLAEGNRKENYTSGFDLTYGWDFNTKLKDAYRGRSAKRIAPAFEKESQNGEHLVFTTNHDFAAWEGSAVEMYRTTIGARAAFAVVALYGGTPLIYNGQEVGWTKRISIFDDTDMPWRLPNEDSDWISAVLKARNRHPAFRTGATTDFSSDDVIGFARTAGADTGMVIANVRDQFLSVQIPLQFQGSWVDLLSGTKVSVGASVHLPAYVCALLARQ